MPFAAAVGLMFGLTGLGAGLEQGLRNVRDSLHTEVASGEIRIVELDARSIMALHSWPWPRRVYARAIDRLNRAGARVIAFDVDFSSQSTPVEDARLAASLARARGSVILPTFRQPAHNGSSEFIENLPIEPLRRKAFLGSVNVHPDRDGQVRRYSWGTVTGGVVRPSIGALLAERSGRLNAEFTIDQSISPDTIPRHSFVDVINGVVPSSELAGKRILIGATAIEFGDRYATPLHGVQPGVVIQAMAAETLLQARTNPSRGWVLPFAVALLLSAAAMRIGRTLPRRSLLTTAFAALLFVPLMMEMMGIGTLEIVPALAILTVVTAGLAVWLVRQNFRQLRLFDDETGLPNQRALSQFERGAVGVAALRVAGLQEIGSVMGEDQASSLMRAVSERLAAVTERQMIYRLDDASLGWIPDGVDVQGATEYFDAIWQILRQPFEVGGRQVQLRLSFGFAPVESGSMRTATAHAQFAAVRAEQGGYRAEIYSQALVSEASVKLSLLGEFDGAIARGELWVAYQPKWCLKAERIVAAEALVRWKHPQRGPIPPDHFIPIIEAEGRTLDLTLFVLGQALADLAAWRAAGHAVGVAVNVSTTLLSDTGIVAAVAGVLARSGVAPSALTLEITEAATIEDPATACAVLEQLRGLGLKISIDDYGTGQSTLSYLKRLPASELKIDKSFVSGLTASRSDQVLVRSTIDMAHELGFAVVAEGVEDRACLDQLALFGCDLVQGWHIGKPVPADEFAARLDGQGDVTGVPAQSAARISA